VTAETASVGRIDETRYRGLLAWQVAGIDCAAVVVPELGGRIMSFRATGRGRHAEVLWQADDPVALKLPDLPGATDLAALRRSLGPLHYGGHKTWLAPQSTWGAGRWPFLDLENGTYAAHVGECLELRSPVCRETGMQLTRRVRAGERGGLHVREQLVNRGRAAARFGLWSVTQVAGRGVVDFPTGGRPVMRFGADGRASPTHDVVPGPDGVATLACDHAVAAKHGTPHAGGWVEARIGAAHFHKAYSGLGDGAWPHGCALEVYDFGPDGPDCFEIELLTPVATLRPGEGLGFAELWRVSIAAEDAAP
jgi:hypothetical protein